MIDFELDRPAGKVTIRIPESARDWELYSDEPGAARAARGMTAALKRSFAAFPKLLAEGHTAPAALNGAARIKGGIRDAMGKYADLGASDSEPRNHAYDAMERFVCAYLFGASDPRAGGALNGHRIEAGF